ncbi:internal scaffolding protein [Blackfly microvirus SF02]|uniref:Internal scaffolding protein n=1 Tax=Blackfly microvirus SF02 TaxID=2576452 RepID=A0A4P8PT69_9VIRU|nr:internal scaffolding protein [Blackfly microvirus SF02]
MPKRQLYSAVNPYRHAVDVDCSVCLSTGEFLPSLTRQEFKDECDINIFMDRYQKGVIGMPAPREPLYVDLTSAPRDLMEAHDIMMAATRSFMSLPAVVRREFDNDAFKFVDFAANPENVAKMREWGLAEPEKVAQAPVEVRVVPDPAAPAAPPKPA